MKLAEQKKVISGSVSISKMLILNYLIDLHVLGVYVTKLHYVA